MTPETPIPPLVVLGYSEAAMYLRSRPVAAVLSIHGPREFGVEADVPHRLDLAFDDVEVARPGDVESHWRTMARRRWAAQNGLVEVGVTVDDVRAIVRFAERVRGVDGPVLCHCGAGLSRGPAAAVVLAAVWLGPGREAAAVDAVRRARPSAVPHAGVIDIADDLLGRAGRLRRAASA